MSNSLVNLGDLSKPVTILIERISDAIGGIAKPWQTVRLAEAEAKASIIQAQSKIEISDLEGRSLLRMVREEGKKQENIENITAKAIPGISQDAKTESVEKDWIVYFFDRCRLTSDEDMQFLWSSILAGEANSPNSFSRRTIDLVSTIDKRDADLFSNLCRFVWTIGEPTPVIFNEKEKIYNDLGINLATLNHLDNVGLVTYNSSVIPAAYQKNFSSENIQISYFGQNFVVNAPENNKSIKIGRVLFTRAGEELSHVCGSSAYNGFADYVVNNLINIGYTVRSL